MNKRLRFPALIAVSVLASACLPDRDNPEDPQGGATVTLVVADAGASCPASISETTPRTTIGTASRGHCLILDATQSLAPDHSALAPDALVEFALTASNGNAIPGVLPKAIPSLADHRLALLGTSIRYGFSSGAPLQFQATVTNGGHRSRAETSFVLQNSVPVAVEDPLRILPPGGYPWGPSPTYQVAFLGESSFDADGDPLTYCFRFPHQATPLCRMKGDPPIIAAIPSTSGVFVALTSVRDADTVSREVPSVVAIRTAPVWGLSPIGPTPLDPARGVLRPVSGAPGIAAIGFLDFGSSASDRLVWYSAPFGSLIEADPTTLAVTGSVLLSGSSPASPRRIVWSRTNATGWLVQSGKIQAFTGTPSSLTAGAIQTIPLGPDVLASVDDSANLWVSTLTTAMVFAQPPGTQSTVLGCAAPAPSTCPGDRRRFAGLAARPGSAHEAWALLPAGTTSGALVRYTDGVASEVFADTRLDSASGLAWSSPDDFWISADGSLRLIDVALLEAGGSVDAATLLAVPLAIDLSQSGNYLVTPDGALQVGTINEAVTVGRSGSVRVDAELSPQFYAVDAQGRVYYRTTFGISAVTTEVNSAFAPGRGFVSLASESTTFPEVTQEGATGGVYFDPGADVFHLAPDGRVTPAVAGVPLHFTGSLKSSADGKSIWWVARDSAFNSLGLFRTTLTATAVPQLVATGAAINNASLVLPDPLGDAGYFVAFTTPPAVKKVDLAGNVTTIFTAPAGDTSPILSIAIRGDGSVCVAEGLGAFGSRVLTTRSFSSAGTLQWTGSTSVAPFLSPTFTSGTRDGGSSCFSGVGDGLGAQTRIVGFTSGTLVRDATINVSAGLNADSASSVWVSPDTGNFQGDRAFRRLQFGAAPTGTPLVTYEFLGLGGSIVP